MIQKFRLLENNIGDEENPNTDKFVYRLGVSRYFIQQDLKVVWEVEPTEDNCVGSFMISYEVGEGLEDVGSYLEVNIVNTIDYKDFVEQLKGWLNALDTKPIYPPIAFIEANETFYLGEAKWRVGNGEET